MADTETIFALATPPGRSALAVFRVSGRGAGHALARLTRQPLAKPRQASLKPIYDPQTGEKIDEALATYFPAPSSYTGEEVVELSVHGGRGVIVALTKALQCLEGLRPAEAGEFTRRAFLNGKLDLSRAEAIADLIDSETEFQRRQALRLMESGLGRKSESWRQRLLAISADLESALDFSDEGDVQGLDTQRVAADIRALDGEIQHELHAGARSMSLRNGFTVVISGAPNVGKSTLFNLLSGSDIAIVTEHAGTTRDLLSVELDLDGVPVRLVDSAGVRDTSDPVEQIGVERARAASASADLTIRLVSGGPFAERHRNELIVWSKSDICPPPHGVPAISAFDSDSISDLVALVRDRALQQVGDGSEGFVVRSRHVDALENARVAFDAAVVRLGQGQIELASEDCRLANMFLGRVSGAFDAEDVLGEVFARFCIGK